MVATGTESAVARSGRPANLGLRLLAGSQLTIVGGYLVGLAMFGYVYARFGGGVDGVGGGYHDPKDLVPGGMHWWNPLTYLYLVVSLSVLLGWLYAAVAVLASVPLLALHRVPSRSTVSRKLWWTLLAATIGAVAVTVVTFTPFGGMVGQWMVD